VNAPVKNQQMITDTPLGSGAEVLGCQTFHHKKEAGHPGLHTLVPACAFVYTMHVHIKKISKFKMVL
jgi:hypothetical protein